MDWRNKNAVRDLLGDYLEHIRKAMEERIDIKDSEEYPPECSDQMLTLPGFQAGATEWVEVPSFEEEKA